MIIIIKSAARDGIKEVKKKKKMLKVEKRNEMVAINCTWKTSELSASDPLSSTVSELPLLPPLPSTPFVHGDLGVFGVCGNDCNNNNNKPFSLICFPPPLLKTEAKKRNNKTRGAGRARANVNDLHILSICSSITSPIFTFTLQKMT